MRSFLVFILLFLVLAISAFVRMRYPSKSGSLSEGGIKVVADDSSVFSELSSEISRLGKKIKNELDGRSPRGSFTPSDIDELLETLDELKDQVWVLDTRGTAASDDKVAAVENLRKKLLTECVALKPMLIERRHRARRRRGLVSIEAGVRKLALHLKGLERWVKAQS